MIIDRREFLKRAAAFSTATACAPWLLSILGNTSCSGFETKAGLDEAEIKSLLANALTRGGDFSEVYSEEVNSLSFKMSEHIFSQAIVGVSSGVGVRTVDGDRFGYGYTNGFDYKKALNAAETAAFIASGNKSTKVAEPYNEKAPDTIQVQIPVDSIGESQKMELMQSAEQAARNFSPHVKQVDITYYDQVQSRKIANSDGLRIENKIPLIWVTIEVLAEKDGVRHQGRVRLSAHAGYEFFDSHNVKEAAEKAANEAVTMLDAKPSPSGAMPVVMYPGWGGVLIHEAVGHGLEGDVIYKGTSIYAGKLGQKVGSSMVTLIDDSSWPNARGTTGFDDEGTIGRKNVLIEDGILRGYMQDLISAKMLNTSPTGNGRRESYRYYPLPRMTNTYLAPRDTEPDEIIADTKKGIYIKALSGGSVDTISGQFNFVVREAYLVENGQVTYPVSGATLIGKGIDVISNIDAVANDLDLGVGTCGKGQWVPVTSGMPTTRIAKGIIVGGNA
jgi:TldD protein